MDFAQDEKVKKIYNAMYIAYKNLIAYTYDWFKNFAILGNGPEFTT